MTNDQLDKCLTECQSWHDSVGNSLNDAQRVEYERLYAFFSSTKYYYQNVLDDAAETTRERAKEQKYLLLGGIPLLLIVWFFQGTNSLGSQILFWALIAAFVYISVMDKVEGRRVSATIRGIERDLSTTNISLSVTYKVIQKEKQFEKVWAAESQDQEKTKRTAAESALLNYYLRDRVLQQVTGHKTERHLPLCAHGIL